MKHGWWCAVLLGCADGEPLPVVDRDGELAGAYDRAAASLTLEVEGAWVVTPSETELELLDAVGEPVGWLVVGEADAAWAEQDVSSRYAGCGQLE